MSDRAVTINYRERQPLEMLAHELKNLFSH